jgi:hypothetical protein
MTPSADPAGHHDRQRLPEPPVAAADTSPQKALAEQSARAATEARAAFERAEEAARAARALAGEARIVAARAARPDLENSERLTYERGARAMSARSSTASGRGWASRNWAMANARPATGVKT